MKRLFPIPLPLVSPTEGNSFLMYAADRVVGVFATPDGSLDQATFPAFALVETGNQPETSDLTLERVFRLFTVHDDIPDGWEFVAATATTVWDPDNLNEVAVALYEKTS